MRDLLILACIAAPSAAAAQPQQEPPPPPALTAALGEWAECLSNGIDNPPDSGSVDAAARAVIQQCEPIQARVLAGHSSWVDGSGLSEREKRQARQSMAGSIDDARRAVARAIRENRSGD